MVVGPSCIVDPAELRIAHQLSQELQKDQNDLTGDTDVRTLGSTGADVEDCATPAD